MHIYRCNDIYRTDVAVSAASVSIAIDQVSLGDIVCVVQAVVEGTVHVEPSEV